MKLESGIVEENTGTNCNDCERYKNLGDVCVIEHGKKFLWEYCKDFEPEVVLPDYKELMSTVRKDLAAERKKLVNRKKRERAIKRHELAKAKKEGAVLSNVDQRPNSAQKNNANIVTASAQLRTTQSVRNPKRKSETARPGKIEGAIKENNPSSLVKKPKPSATKRKSSYRCQSHNPPDSQSG